MYDVKEVTRDEFVHRMQHYFGFAGAGALYDYFENCEKTQGTIVEFDESSFSTYYIKYDSIEEFAEIHQFDDAPSVEDLREESWNIIEVGDGSIIVEDF